MSNLELFLHEDRPDLPLLIKAGLVHVQFETIHPYLDGNGRIVGANVAALEWLGVPAHSSLCGQRVEQVFGLDLARLETLRGDPASAEPLPQRDRGSLCYGIVQPPQLPQTISSGAAAVRPRVNALVQAERKVLREVLERCRWNVSLAATQLNLSRRTLHRKLKSHGMRRYSAWEAGPSARSSDSDA